MIADKDPAETVVRPSVTWLPRLATVRPRSVKDGAVMIENESVDVFLGVDVGKSAHHAVALGRDGRVLLDRPLPNDEARLREVIGELKG